MTTPSHQYPTGRVMSLLRRLALIERARQSGTWIIEDDYDSEFRRAGPAPPALFGSAQRPGRSRRYFQQDPLSGPAPLAIWCCPTPSPPTSPAPPPRPRGPGRGIEQRTLADFIQRGYYTAHLRRMRARYAAREVALRAALKKAFGPSVELSGGEAGLHLVMWFPDGIRDTDVEKSAEELG